MVSWTPQKFSNEERLNVANEILEALLKKYGPKLISVAIEGSTAKRLDYAESDLEMRVVIEERDEDWYPFFYKGMFVCISFNSIQGICSEAKIVDYEWCVKGDTMFTCKVLYDPTNLYGKLRDTAKGMEERANFNALLREALADMYEHIYKVFTLKESDTITAANEARQIAYWAAMSVGLKNKVKYLSSRTMYQDSFQLESLPEGYKKNIQGLLSLDTNVKCIKENVSDLWTSFVSWSKENNVELVENNLSFL